MTSDSRRRIAERVLARLSARGFQFDTDPQFQSFLTDWIDGTIDMAGLRARYQEILEARRELRFDRLQARRVTAAAPSRQEGIQPVADRKDDDTSA